jgi:hypothetical protein
MVACPHCGGTHEEAARFCSLTGKPIAAATTERVRPLGEQKGVWDLLQEATALYRSNPRDFLITAAVLFVPGSLLTSWAVVALWFSEATGFAATLLTLLGWAVSALVLYGVVLPLTQAALTIAVADRALGGDAQWRQHWSRLLQRLAFLISAIGPMAALLAVAFFLGVVPGMVVAFFSMFVAPVALVEGLRGPEAWKRSYTLVRADWLRSALMLVAFGVAWAMAHWLAGLFVRTAFLATFCGDLLFLLVMPVPLMGSVLLYADLRRTMDGLAEDALFAELVGTRSAQD